MLSRLSRFRRGKHDARTSRPLIDVWLNPSAGQSASRLAGELAKSVHLVVVPKTGTRLADVAVLPDPDPAELEGISRLLPKLPLLATTHGSPSERLRAAANRAGALLLTDPTPAELLNEITQITEIHRSHG
jgi:hypothetical protein